VPGKRGTLRRYIAAGTFTHLAVLYRAEDDHSGENGREGEAETHESIIGPGRSAVLVGPVPKKNQASRARTMSTMAAITHGVFERRRLNSDWGGGGATFGSVVDRPQR
jgi:hypothetical protein